MKNSFFCTKDIVKYLIVSGIIYAILKMLPSTQLADKDLLLLLLIITIGFICLDCLFIKNQNEISNFGNTNPFSILKETLTDLVSTTDTTTTSSTSGVSTVVASTTGASTVVAPTVAAPTVVAPTTGASTVVAPTTGASTVVAPTVAAPTVVAPIKKLNDEIYYNPNANNQNNLQTNIAQNELSDIKYLLIIRKNNIEELKKSKTTFENNKNIEEAEKIQKLIDLIYREIQILDARIIVTTQLIDNTNKLSNQSLDPNKKKELENDRNSIINTHKSLIKSWELILKEKYIIVNQNRSFGVLNDINQDLEDAKNIMSTYNTNINTDTETNNNVITEPKDQMLYNTNTNNIKTSCGLEVEQIKKDMEIQILQLKQQIQSQSAVSPADSIIANKYFESLISDLENKGIIDNAEINNIKTKIRSKLLTLDEVIASLEILKKEGNSNKIVKNDREYSELPSEFYDPLGNKIANNWDNEYTILNTNKWQVPMARPPVCINTSPCKVCPSASSNYPVNLKEWDDSRSITGGKLNKKWAADQL